MLDITERTVLFHIESAGRKLGVSGRHTIISRAVAGLAAYGLEPRHLRGYRSSADREVGLFAQLVAPLARQSDPAARARAAERRIEAAAVERAVVLRGADGVVARLQPVQADE